MSASLVCTRRLPGPPGSAHTPQPACPGNTSPGPEDLSPTPSLGQRGLSGPWAGPPHHPDPTWAPPWSWSQCLADQGTRGAFSTSVLGRLRFSHRATPEPLGAGRLPSTLRLSLPGLTSFHVHAETAGLSQCNPGFVFRGSSECQGTPRKEPGWLCPLQSRALTLVV